MQGLRNAALWAVKIQPRGRRYGYGISLIEPIWDLLP